MTYQDWITTEGEREEYRERCEREDRFCPPAEPSDRHERLMTLREQIASVQQEARSDIVWLGRYRQWARESWGGDENAARFVAFCKSEVARLEPITKEYTERLKVLMNEELKLLEEKPK